MTTALTRADVAPAASVKRRRRAPGRLAVVPLLAFTLLAFGLPALAMLNGAFTVQDPATGAESHTAANLTTSLHGAYLTALLGSVKLSAVAAGLAALLGLPLAQAVVTTRSRVLRESVLTASGVLANFGGVPLAFAFVATLGNAGVLTRHLGLTVDGLRSQWREAAQNSGATAVQYWRHVALPVLAPSLLGGLVLLFGSAFAAYATAAAMVGSSVPLVTLQIADALSGNVLVGQEHVALALSLDMVLVAGLVMAVYLPLQRRSARWLA
ncbi:ABC transporter permease [Streptomyces sp. NPDC001275]